MLPSIAAYHPYYYLSLPIAVCFAQLSADYLHYVLVSSAPVSGGGREGPHRSGGARAIGGTVYTGEAVVRVQVRQGGRGHCFSGRSDSQSGFAAEIRSSVG